MSVTPITGCHMHEFRNLTSPQRVVGPTPTKPRRAGEATQTITPRWSHTDSNTNSIKSRRIRWSHTDSNTRCLGEATQTLTPVHATMKCMSIFYISAYIGQSHRQIPGEVTQTHTRVVSTDIHVPYMLMQQSIYIHICNHPHIPIHIFANHM